MTTHVFTNWHEHQNLQIQHSETQANWYSNIPHLHCTSYTDICTRPCVYGRRQYLIASEVGYTNK